MQEIALENGVEISSTGTPALNGTYSTSEEFREKIDETITYIGVNGSFPDGVSELPLEDMAGNIHTFPDTTTFKNFATAYANYVAAVLYAIDAGTLGSLPSNQVTIA